MILFGKTSEFNNLFKEKRVKRLYEDLKSGRSMKNLLKFNLSKDGIVTFKSNMYEIALKLDNGDGSSSALKGLGEVKKN